MNNKLFHHFLTTAHDVKELFEGTTLLSQFKRKLENQATLDTDRYEFDKYIGDGFEFLVELIIKLSPTDNRIGITQYRPVPNNQDNGVDGYGLNLLGKKCAIQVKYRVDTSKLLTAKEDNLNSFLVEALLNDDIIPEQKEKIKNHYLFTTAKGLHYYTDDTKFRNSVKCFGYQELREILDNNIHFWNACMDIIEENLAAKKLVKI
jgi:hypothetical protein